MSTKLIQITEYLLLIDEKAEIKEGKTFITKDNIVHSNYGYNYGDRVVVAYYPLTKEAKELDLPLLPEFEDDVKKLAKEECKYNHKSIDELSFRLGFEIGYETAQEKGTFTLEDVKKAIEIAQTPIETGIGDYYPNISEIIQSLSAQQLPKEFIISDKFSTFEENIEYGKYIW